MEKMKKEQERKLEYELIRSNRKGLALQVKEDGSVIVRAPLRIAERRIEIFVADHWEWVEKQKQRISRQRENARRITGEERQEGFSEGKRDHSPADGIFCRADGRELWTDHYPGTENTLGKLQPERKPEF